MREPTAKDLARHHQILHLNPTAEAMVHYLVYQNPGATNKEVAKEMGVSKNWVSIIRNSHTFKERLRDEWGEIRAEWQTDITAKAKAAVNETLDRMLDVVQDETSVRTLTETADKLLQRLGYVEQNAGGASGNPQYHLHMHQSSPPAEVLEGARQKIGMYNQGAPHSTSSVLREEGYAPHPTEFNNPSEPPQSPLQAETDSQESSNDKEGQQQKPQATGAGSSPLPFDIPGVTDKP